MAAHEHAGESQNRWNEAQQGPERLGPYVQSAEMRVGEPCKDDVAKSEFRGPCAIQDVHDVIEELRETEIEARASPHQYKEKAPESQHVVSVPIDTRKTGSPIHLQAAAPMLDSRPPDDGSGQAKQSQERGTDAVHPTARVSHQ